MDRIDSQETVYNPIIDGEAKGFLDYSVIEYYRRNSSLDSIPVGLEYRPDLIARHFLGNERLAWLISAVNNFNGGVKDYTEGRMLLIPNVK